MKRLIIAAFVIFGFASPALAGHCPKDVKLIDAALATQSNAKAKALRDKGDGLHKSKSHKESLAALHESMEILGIKH
jgi:hypothetical protein